MRLHRFLLSALVLGIAAACDDTLTVEPTTEVSEDAAFADAVGARAALNGAYGSLTDDEVYGVDLLIFTDLSSDNLEHTGTFGSYAEGDDNSLTAQNGAVEGIWEETYESIARTNTLIKRVPEVPGLSSAEKDEMIGEALFLRALNYHNLVRLFGGVPLVTEPPQSISELANLQRATRAAVYQQILADLDQAEQLITTEQANDRASLGAVRALRSRVLLYTEDWAGVVAAANAVEAMGYQLAPNYGSLFGDDVTPEDIFEVRFTATEFQYDGYYLLPESMGGRQEASPTDDLVAAYEDDDLRKAWNIGTTEDNVFGTKWKTGTGVEDIPAIRFAEVILNKAEALARQGKLAEAIAEYNRIRERAGLDPHTLGVEVTTQEQVIEAILNERRLELAFEGDRWPDLIRTGRAVETLNLADRPFQALYPIPQSEIDVAAQLEQNPGY